MKLKPIIFLAAAAGVAAVVRKRSSQAGELASQAAGAAAGAASTVADKAKDAAPESVKEAVEKVAEKATGGNGAAEEDRDATRRYSAPAEAGAQPPETADGAPADDPTATVVRSVPQDPTDLATPPDDLADDVVVPDTSTDDPTVQEAEAAAAADAANIGSAGDDEPQP